MTKQEAVSALELPHCMRISYVEVASLCGCTVRELEQLSEKGDDFSHRPLQRAQHPAETPN